MALVMLLYMSRHYKQAYTHVIELRLVDTNILEVKTVAGFLNYKACQSIYGHVYLLCCLTGACDQVKY